VISFCFHIIHVLLLQSISVQGGAVVDGNVPYSRQMMSVCNLSIDSLKPGVNNLVALTDTLKHDSLSMSLKNLSISVDTLMKSKHEIFSLRLRFDSIPKGLQTTANQFGDATYEKADSLINASQDKFDAAGKQIERKKHKIQSEINVQDKLLGSQTVIPEAQSVYTDKIDIPLQAVEFSGVLISSSIPSVPKIEQPSIDIPKMEVSNIAGQVNGLHQKSQDVTDKFKTAEEYKSKIGQTKVDSIANKDKLAQLAEKHAENATEVKAVKDGTGKLTSKQAEYEAMMQRYRDKKFVEEEINRKIKNVANDKVSQLTPAVQDAQKSLLKGKKIQRETSSSKSLLLRKGNAMAGKPLQERLVPGVMLQLYNKSIYSVDVAAQLGYRASGRIISGIATVYRLGFQKNIDMYIRSMHVFGARTYTDVSLLKGFFVRGELEWLDTEDMIHATKEQASDCVWSGYSGIGKQYNVTRHLKGNVLLLYRAEFKGRLPDQSKLNLRVAVNVVKTKKRRKDILLIR